MKELIPPHWVDGKQILLGGERSVFLAHDKEHWFIKVSRPGVGDEDNPYDTFLTLSEEAMSTLIDLYNMTINLERIK